jgi:ABC-type branched-subunit amino acid transport system permease subunit
LFVLGALFVLVTVALPKGLAGFASRFRRLRHA